MNTLIIIAGAVVLIAGLYLFIKGSNHEEEAIPTHTTIDEPFVVEEPTVVVNHVVVEPTKEAKPKKAPQAAQTGTTAPKKKYYRKPASKKPSADKK